MPWGFSEAHQIGRVSDFFMGRSSWHEVLTAATSPMELFLKRYCLKHGGRCPVSFPVNFTAGCPVCCLLQCQALSYLLTDLNDYPRFSTCRAEGSSGDIWQKVVNNYHTWVSLFTSQRMSLSCFWHRFKRNFQVCQEYVKIDIAYTNSFP